MNADASWLTSEHPRLAWEVFKEFGRVPVDDVSSDPDDMEDGLMFQNGVFEFGDYSRGRNYHFAMVRQFSFTVDGEYDHMDQLEVCFLYAPNEKLESLPADVEWSFEAVHEAFYATVEALPGFRSPLEKGLVPIAVIVEQQTV